MMKKDNSTNEEIWGAEEETSCTNIDMSTGDLGD